MFSFQSSDNRNLIPSADKKTEVKCQPKIGQNVLTIWLTNLFSVVKENIFFLSGPQQEGVNEKL